MDPSASPVPPSPPTPTDGSEMKKRDKVRSAWISFIGRIVAQIVGAVASITLAILFLQRAQGPETTLGTRRTTERYRPSRSSSN